jgi:LmbE family N-acetylglucosaminyl deacetylase
VGPGREGLGRQGGLTKKRARARPWGAPRGTRLAGCVARMLLVISPHLDDAVLSCGQALAACAGSTVLTVFAGVPRAARQSTDWDRRCGFASAAEAIACRRGEDERALRVLDARPLWLDFCDAQYGQPPSARALRQQIRAAVRRLRPQRLLYPLGLFHGDHLLCHAACRDALAPHGLPPIQALAYEDVPYRAAPGLLQARLAELADQQLRATPACMPLAGRRATLAKVRALRAYASQLRALGADRLLADARRPERCWLLDKSQAVIR